MHGGSAFEALVAARHAERAPRRRTGDLAGSVSALRHALDVARRELHRGELDDPVGGDARLRAQAGRGARRAASSGTTPTASCARRSATRPPTSEHRARLLGVLARVAQRAPASTREARRYLDEAMRVARQSDARELMPMLERIEKHIAVA